MTTSSPDGNVTRADASARSAAIVAATIRAAVRRLRAVAGTPSAVAPMQARERHCLSAMSDEKQAVSDLSTRLLEEAEIMQRLEREKRGLPISSPEFHRVAEEVAVRSRTVFSLASEEEQVGDLTRPSDETIDDLSSGRV